MLRRILICTLFCLFPVVLAYANSGLPLGAPQNILWSSNMDDGNDYLTVLPDVVILDTQGLPLDSTYWTYQFNDGSPPSQMDQVVNPSFFPNPLNYPMSTNPNGTTNYTNYNVLARSSFKPYTVGKCKLSCTASYGGGAKVVTASASTQIMPPTGLYFDTEYSAPDEDATGAAVMVGVKLKLGDEEHFYDDAGISATINVNGTDFSNTMWTGTAFLQNIDIPCSEIANYADYSAIRLYKWVVVINCINSDGGTSQYTYSIVISCVRTSANTFIAVMQ